VKSTGLKWTISLGLALLNVYPVKCEAYLTGAEPILSGRSIFNWGVPVKQDALKNLKNLFHRLIIVPSINYLVHLQKVSEQEAMISNTPE
jgi:hypothetical protein